MAIAFDAVTAGGSTSGSSKTFAHTTGSGSDRYLLVGILWTGNSDEITGVTYNGVAMQRLGIFAGHTGYIIVYGLAAPSTGSNNVIISAGTSGTIVANAVSYTGVHQTIPVDNFISQFNNGVSSGAWNGATLRTRHTDTWGILFSNKTNGGSISAGGGTTHRASSNGFGILDSNAALGAPANESLSAFASDGTQNWAHMMINLIPAGATLTDEILIHNSTFGNNTDFTHVFPTGLSNTALIVIVGTHQGNITGITYGGNAMTKLSEGSSTFDEDGSIWILLNPPTGSNTVDITRSGGSWHGAVAVSLSNVKQTTSVTQVSEGGNESSPDINITPSTDQNLIITAIGSEAYCYVDDPQVGWAAIHGASYENMIGSFYLQPTAATFNSQTNMSSGQRYGLAVVALEKASGAVREQEGFRFRADDGSESGATWLASQDTDLTRAKNLTTRLRMLVNATSGDPDSAQYQLEYRKLETASVSTEDTFDSSLSGIWSVSSGTNANDIAVVGGEVVIGSNGAATSSTMWVTSTFSLVNKWVQVKVVDPSNDCALFVSANLNPATTGDIYSENDWYRWSLLNTQFGIQRRIGSGSQTTIAGHSSSPTAPYWVRIKFDGTTIYFDYAESEPTSEDDWTTFYSEEWALNVAEDTAMYVGLHAWNEPSNGEATFDDFKIVDFVPTTEWTKVPTPSVSFNTQIADGDDDAEQFLSDNYTDTISSDLEMLWEGEEIAIGLRFQNVTIPPGATITSAYIRFVVDVSHTGTVAVDIHGEDADNPGAWTDAETNGVLGRTQTTASVTWNVGGSGASANATVDTSDLTAIVQEIVDRGGWASGNAMVFIFDNPSTSNFREFESYDGEAGDAPRLFITYTVPDDILMSASSNITASGENTTAQLTAPSGKTSGSDFDAGRIQDDENPADAVDIGDGGYTELEWSIIASNNVSEGDVFEFRVTDAGTPLSTYTVVPQWTIGSGAVETDKTFTVDAIVATRNTQTFTVDAIVKVAQTATFTVDGIIEFPQKPDTPILDQEHSLASGLLLAWLFDEGSGTAITDYSGNGHAGTAEGGTSWTTGDYGPELVLDGTDGRVTNDSFPDLANDARTLLILIKNQTTSGVNVIASIGNNINSGAGERRFGFYSNGTTLNFWAGNEPGDTELTTSYTTGNHWLVATKPDTTTGGLAYYDSLTPISLDEQPETGPGFVVGVNDQDVGNDWHPQINIIAAFIWERVITSDELAELGRDPFVFLRGTTATYTETFTVDGIVVEKVEESFTVDAIVKEINEQSFTVDAIILEQQTECFTVDGIVLETQTQSFTADAIVLETLTQSFTIDAIIKEIQSFSFTVDGIVKTINTQSFTADAIVLAPTLKTFTIDAIVLVETEQTFTVDGLVLAQTDQTFTIDAIVLETQEQTFTADAIIKVLDNEQTFTVDAIVLEQQEQSFTIDAIIFATNEQSFTVDGIVLVTTEQSFTADAIIKVLDNEQSFTVDAIVLEEQTASFTVDAIILVETTATFTADGLVLATQEQSFTVDGIVFATNEATFTVDAIVTAGTAFQFTVDGIVKATQEHSFTVDGYIQDSFSQSFTVDAIIKEIQQATFTVDGIVLVETEQSFTVDAIVKSIEIATFTIDALIKTLDNEASFTIDAIVKAQQEASFTVDAIIEQVNSQTFTVDAIVLEQTTITFTIDGIVKAQTSETFTVDAIVLEQRSASFTIDAYIATRSIKTFTIDALVKASTPATFTVDALIIQREAIQAGFTVDGIIVDITFSSPGGKTRGGLYDREEQYKPLQKTRVPVISDPDEQVPTLFKKNPFSYFGDD